MRHKLPQISEVNVEIKDFDYYFQSEFDDENLGFEISVTTNLQKPCGIVFFIHLRFAYQEFEDDKPFTLFHTDYISYVDFEEVDWEVQQSVELKQDLLAHLFGMSFLMIRGSIKNRLSANVLSEIQIPIINPKELLAQKLESNQNNFIVSEESFDEEE